MYVQVVKLDVTWNRKLVPLLSCQQRQGQMG